MGRRKFGIGGYATQRSGFACKSQFEISRPGVKMTIEARNTVNGSSLHHRRRDSNSSNGYQDSPSETDDGYFTSAVSVQHKVGHSRFGDDVILYCACPPNDATQIT